MVEKGTVGTVFHGSLIGWLECICGLEGCPHSLCLVAKHGVRLRFFESWELGRLLRFDGWLSLKAFAARMHENEEKAVDVYSTYFVLIVSDMVVYVIHNVVLPREYVGTERWPSTIQSLHRGKSYSFQYSRNDRSSFFIIPTSFLQQKSSDPLSHLDELTPQRLLPLPLHNAYLLFQILRQSPLLPFLHLLN